MTVRGVRFWNEERKQSPVSNIGDLEKYMSQESVTGVGSLGQIEGEYAPEENGVTLAEDGSTPQLNY